jgi:hypothetical protein
MVTGFHHGWLFCARCVAAILLCLGTSAPTLAQSPPPRPSGSGQIQAIPLYLRRQIARRLKGALGAEAFQTD